MGVVICIVGQTFGRLTVLSQYGRNLRNDITWECKCTCGKKHIVAGRHLKSGGTMSCGCLNSENIRKSKLRKDLTGMTFGRLTVIEQSGRDKNGQVRWLCKCICGNITSAIYQNIKEGRVVSCGCFLKERIIECKTTHGDCSRKGRAAEYTSYANMMDRCTNPNNKRSKDYSERGIKVCSGWSKSYPSFLQDMGRKVYPELSVDRIDNDGNYSCGHCEECLANGWKFNCRWGTREQQARNKRNNRMIDYNGEKLVLAEWANRLKVKQQSLGYYLKTHTISQAVEHYNY